MPVSTLRPPGIPPLPSWRRRQLPTDAVSLIVKECVARLSAHSWAEEERVYPAIVQADPPDRGEVYHGVEEHHEAEQLLHKLEEADPQSPDFEAVLEEFIAAVKQHVEEEETKILPALAESVDRAKLDELGAAFEERRMAVLTITASAPRRARRDSAATSCTRRRRTPTCAASRP
jgi:hemerythrin superfamily protein